MAVRKQLLLFAVLAVVLVFSESFPLTSVENLISTHEELSGWYHALSELVKQSDGSCTDDLSQLTSRKFHSCIGVFEHTSNLGHFTNASLESYCNQNCSNYIWNLLTALATDCGNSPPDTTAEEFVKQSCKQGARNTYCIEDWNAIVSSTFTPTIAMEYRNCTEKFPTSSTCPTECKNFMQWVTENVGCCARVPIDYSEPGFLPMQKNCMGRILDMRLVSNMLCHDHCGVCFLHSRSLSTEYWTRCGYKEPVQCPEDDNYRIRITI